MRAYLLRAAAWLALLALAGCVQPTSVPSGAPPTPIVLHTPFPTATPIPPAPVPSPAPPAPLSVYVALSNEGLAALDASTGKVRWQRPIGAATTLALVNNILYVGTDYGVYALNALDGTMRWKRPIQAGSSVGLVVQNNIVYAASQGGNIQALNASDGAVRWGQAVSFQLNSLALDQGRLFASSPFGTLAAWDLDGNQLWSQQSSDVSFSRVVAANGLLYVAENFPAGNPSLPHLLAFSQDGQPIWDIVPGYGGTLAAPVVTADGLIYTADAQGLYAIDPLKGTTRWQVQRGGGLQMGNQMLAVAGNVVMRCALLSSSQVREAQIQAFSTGEGKPYWQATLNATIPPSTPPLSCLALGETLVVEAFGGLAAFNSTSGTRLWQNLLNNQASPWLTIG